VALAGLTSNLRSEILEMGELCERTTYLDDDLFRLKSPKKLEQYFVNDRCVDSVTVYLLRLYRIITET
jgi:hypothetical protein